MKCKMCGADVKEKLYIVCKKCREKMMEQWKYEIEAKRR